MSIRESMKSDFGISSLEHGSISSPGVLTASRGLRLLLSQRKVPAGDGGRIELLCGSTKVGEMSWTPSQLESAP